MSQKNNPESMIAKCIKAIVEASNVGEVTFPQFSRIILGIVPDKQSAKCMRKELMRRGYAKRVILVTGKAHTRYYSDRGAK
jgi:hypothetical protein